MSELLTLQQLKDLKKLAFDLGANSCDGVSGATASLSVPNNALKVNYPTPMEGWVEEPPPRETLALANTHIMVSQGSMSSSGTIFVVGLPQYNAYAGRAEVWEYDNQGGRARKASFTPGLGNGANFGESVAMSADGSRFVVGAYGYNSSQGYVSIYEWNGTMVPGENPGYTNTSNPLGPANSQSQFGKSVAMSADGSTIVVGAAQYDSGRGRVYVKKKEGNNWVDQTFEGDTDYKNGENLWNYFGEKVSVSADGNTIAVLSTHYAHPNKGAVYVYSKNTNDKYQLVGPRLPPYSDYPRGLSLSASGTVLAIGNQNYNSNDTNVGAVQVYEWSHGTDFFHADGTWAQRCNLLEGTADENLGRHLSMSPDGSVLVASVENADNGNLSDTGGVRIYDWNNGTSGVNGTGEYVERLTILGPTAYEYCQYNALSSDGKVLLLGTGGSDWIYEYNLWGTVYRPAPQTLQYAIGDLAERVEALESQ